MYDLYIVEKFSQLNLIRLNLETQETRIVAKGDNIRLSRIKKWMIKTQQFSRICLICNAEYPPIVSKSKTCSSACQRKLNSKNVAKNYLRHRERIETQHDLVKKENELHQKPVSWAEKQVRLACWCTSCLQTYSELAIKTTICDQCLSLAAKQITPERRNICKK